MPMNRRTLLAVPLLFLAATLPARAEIVPMETLSRYMNALDSAVSPFLQTNADGTTSQGTLYIKRPGRARFEYEPPNKALVLASAGSVAIFDDKSNQAPEQYPLRRTPLNLILARNVDLSRANMVIGHREDGDTTRLLAQDPKNPEYGTIELIFTSDPVALVAWMITDDLGNQTIVELQGLQSGVRLRETLFDIGAETRKRTER
jgi:outer membrane lipoprotein-sorting protein